MDALVERTWTVCPGVLSVPRTPSRVSPRKHSVDHNPQTKRPFQCPLLLKCSVDGEAYKTRPAGPRVVFRPLQRRGEPQFGRLGQDKGGMARNAGVSCFRASGRVEFLDEKLECGWVFGLWAPWVDHLRCHPELLEAFVQLHAEIGRMHRIRDVLAKHRG